MGLGEDSVLLVLSFTIYGFAGYIFLRQAGGFAITPAALFFLFFTIFTYVGGLTLFFSSGEGVSYGGGDRNYMFYLAIHAGIMAIALGSIFATIAFGFSPQRELARFRRSAWREKYNQPGDNLVITLIGLVALTMSVIYIYNRGSLPIIQVLLAQGEPDLYDLAYTAREEFSRYGRGAGSYFYQGYFQQFYLIILPFVTLFIASRYLYYRKAILMVLWLGLGILSSFFLAVSLQRWPLMFFLFMNYVLYVYYVGRIRISHALAFGTLILSLFGLLTYIRGMENFGMLVDWVVARLFDTDVNVLYSMFEMFPQHFQFFGGQAIFGDIKAVLPGPDVGFSRWLFDAVYKTYGNGTAPTIFWGELYADFGLPGVLTGSLLAGFIMQWLYITFIRSAKKLHRLVIFAIITVALAGLAITFPVTVLFQLGIITSLLLIVTLAVMRWFLHAGPFPAARYEGMGSSCIMIGKTINDLPA